MTVRTEVRDGGSIKLVNEMHVRDGGSIKEVHTAFVKDGGVIKPFHCAQPLRTATQGSDGNMYVYTTFHWGDMFTTTGVGFDLGLDYYYNSPNFGALDDQELWGCDGITRTIVAIYRTTSAIFGQFVWINIDTPSSITPNNDDVWRTCKIHNTLYTRSAMSSQAYNTSGRWWNFTGNPNPHPGSGNYDIEFTVGKA